VYVTRFTDHGSLADLSSSRDFQFIPVSWILIIRPRPQLAPLWLICIALDIFVLSLPPDISQPPTPAFALTRGVSEMSRGIGTPGNQEWVLGAQRE